MKPKIEIMKHTIVLILSLCTLFAAQAQKQIIDKVIATVGSELILLSEVEEQYALTEANQGQLPPNARCVILDNLLTQNLLLNQAKLDSVLVTDEEVEVQLNARIERILSLMNNDTEQFEAYYGQSVDEVKERFREDLKAQILTERMRSQIMSNITVTPSEVKAFFEKIPTDSLPYFNSEVEIGEIVMEPEVNAEQRKMAIDQLSEIRRQIVEEGADFAEMASQYSEDGSARVGGDLGWTKRGAFVQAFEAAAYNLEQGEISDVVESEFGFHLIQLLGRRGNSINTRHILIKPEITDADLERTKEKLDSVRMLIESDSISFSLAVKRFSNENYQSATNDGRMVNPATGNTFFEIGDLDPDIYFTVDTLKVGEVSAPFEFQGQSGETTFRVVQLQSRTEPHVANLRQDYSKIQQAAIESKKNEYIANWVEDKISQTFINIDPMFADCQMLSRWRRDEMRP